MHQCWSSGRTGRGQPGLETALHSSLGCAGDCRQHLQASTLMSIPSASHPGQYQNPSRPQSQQMLNSPHRYKVHKSRTRSATINVTSLTQHRAALNLTQSTSLAKRYFPGCQTPLGWTQESVPGEPGHALPHAQHPFHARSPCT